MRGSEFLFKDNGDVFHSGSSWCCSERPLLKLDFIDAKPA